MVIECLQRRSARLFLKLSDVPVPRPALSVPTLTLATVQHSRFEITHCCLAVKVEAGYLRAQLQSDL